MPANDQHQRPDDDLARFQRAERRLRGGLTLAILQIIMGSFSIVGGAVSLLGRSLQYSVTTVLTIAFLVFLFLSLGFIMLKLLIRESASERVLAFLEAAHYRICPKCGYDLRGAGSLHCPECGEPASDADLRPAWERKHPSLRSRTP